MTLDKEQIRKIDLWVEVSANRNFSREQRDFSYQKWAKGGKGWNVARQGGVGVMLMLCWYHHEYKPKSAEWRPKVIIGALVAELSQAKAA